MEIETNRKMKHDTKNPFSNFYQFCMIKNFLDTPELCICTIYMRMTQQNYFQKYVENKLFVQFVLFLTKINVLHVVDLTFHLNYTSG